MVTEPNIKSIPLAVDLDGTLISADLLWECVFTLMRVNPLLAFMIPVWLFTGGIKRLKSEVFSRVDMDVASLPYRPEVLDYIKTEKKRGRKIILATASFQEKADQIAAHLGIFDEAHGSHRALNLKASAKMAFLVETYGEGGFDYMGNSRDDIKVFEAAREAIVVAPDEPARNWAAKNNAVVLADKGPLKPKEYAKMLRVHQWAKNVLIAVAPILDQKIFEIVNIFYIAGAFFAFSFLASAVYIFNDLFDLSMDRAHATKRNRPLAAGRIHAGTGIKIAFGLVALAVLISLFLPIEFGIVLGCYFVITTVYSLKVKRWLLVDVLTLAGLYTVRIIAGMAATLAEPSFWLLAFAVFFFLSLALVKRYVELDHANDLGEKEKLSGRGYRAEDKTIIAQAGIASAFASVVVLALYLQSPSMFEAFRDPYLLWPICPLVLYIILRIWILANRREFNEDPVTFILTDWRSQVMVGFGGILVLLATFTQGFWWIG